MITTPIRHVVRLLAAAVFSAAAPSVHAADFPVRPIRLVVPYAPGGGGDTLARLVSDHLGERLGQAVVVDNRPGGGTIIGTELVARATPDGHTLLLNTAALAINPSLHPKLPYDTLNDLAPVVQLVDLPNVLVVHPSVPATTVAELLVHAREKRGLTYGSSGIGTVAHLAGELFRSMAKIELVHVPYKGGGAVMPDLLAARLAMTFATLPGSIPHVKAGRLRALATASGKRSSALPEMPTIAEAGLAGYDASNWLGVLAPGRTPGAIVDRLNAELRAALQAPAVRDRLPALGFEPMGGSAGDFRRALRAEIPKWQRLVRESNLKAE